MTYFSDFGSRWRFDALYGVQIVKSPFVIVAPDEFHRPPSMACACCDGTPQGKFIAEEYDHAKRRGAVGAQRYWARRARRFVRKHHRRQM